MGIAEGQGRVSCKRRLESQTVQDVLCVQCSAMQYLEEGRRLVLPVPPWPRCPLTRSDPGSPAGTRGGGGGGGGGSEGRIRGGGEPIGPALLCSALLYSTNLFCFWFLTFSRKINLEAFFCKSELICCNSSLSASRAKDKDRQLDGGDRGE
jgi:hypothetical protein